MSDPADRFAAEAERLAGTRFRLHGRDPRTGLDCIGLAACALGRAGLEAAAPAGYALRNIAIARHLDCIELSGFTNATGPIRRGDLVLVRPGPAQHHLLVALGPARFVHAHAGLGRVAVQSGLSGWPVLHHWRLVAQ
jgi:cell wall-associated NlpC family hydrolase